MVLHMFNKQNETLLSDIRMSIVAARAVTAREEVCERYDTDSNCQTTMYY